MGICNSCGGSSPGGSKWCESCYDKGLGNDVVAKVAVGSDVDVDLRLEARTISGRHALFELWLDGRIRVTDLNSTNGVFVNNVRVQTGIVCPGDSVRLGGVHVDVRAVEHLLAKNKARAARNVPDRQSPAQESQPARSSSSAMALYIAAGVILTVLVVTLVVVVAKRKPPVVRPVITAENSSPPPRAPGPARPEPAPVSPPSPPPPPAEPPGLPPDPGSAGSKEIACIDSDSDGLRDDVQRYIALEFRDSLPTRNAMTQVAIGQQGFLLASADSDEARQSATNVVRGVECLYSIHGSDSRRVLDGLNAQIVNTPKRLEAFFAAEKHLGGQIFPIAAADQLASSCKAGGDR